MKIHDNDMIESMFMQNYFCVMPEYNMAFVNISKNASVFLKCLAIYIKTGIYPSESVMYRLIGFKEDNGFLIPVSQFSKIPEYGNYLKFAVWRDPVDRLVSCYKLFCLEKENRTYFKYLSLYKDNSFERFMQFVRFELGKSDPLYQDEHIRRQSDYYSPDEVDFIVDIKNLNGFLKEYNVPLPKESDNKTYVDFEISGTLFIDEVRELYKSDYNIMPNY